ncbi:hypothetical protein DPMN_036078 [Dreissena polymorpha]|uniref:Uncharacterized protein n=1 Tax=Dreissena polymorpha TaxID=45954 RepID=A0A9D4M8S8_DREPO|nr:hypothetical protein DPMN_036078 [Dreissena polymorpha]
MTLPYLIKEGSNPLGNHEHNHHREAKRDVACGLNDNHCETDCHLHTASCKGDQIVEQHSGKTALNAH